MRVFLGWLRGEKRHCSMVAIPTIEEEDARRPNREHQNLITEQTRLLRRGDIKGRKACAGAPCVIRAEDLAGFAKGKRCKPPLTQNATQHAFDFQ